MKTTTPPVPTYRFKVQDWYEVHARFDGVRDMNIHLEFADGITRVHWWSSNFWDDEWWYKTRMLTNVLTISLGGQ